MNVAGMSAALVVAVIAVAVSGAIVWAQSTSGAMAIPTSGYQFKKPRTRAIQDDDAVNPAFLWIEAGAAAWPEAEGEAGKACEGCHGAAESSMKGVGARYPEYHAPSGKLVNLEQRINLCRTENMKAPAWAWESPALLAMTAYVKLQSRAMPTRVRIDGPARPFFEKGEAFFHQRRGQLNMACAHCHVAQAGKQLRAQLLSQAQVNGFPTYFLGFQSLVSIQRMFRFCNGRTRSIPYDYGAEEYVDLELYMAWRGNDLAVETPAVR